MYVFSDPELQERYGRLVRHHEHTLNQIDRRFGGTAEIDRLIHLAITAFRDAVDGLLEEADRMDNQLQFPP
jgi:hypothetical protein